MPHNAILSLTLEFKKKKITPTYVRTYVRNFFFKYCTNSTTLRSIFFPTPIIFLIVFSL